MQQLGNAGPRFRFLGELVPCHRRRLMTAIACHLIRPGLNPLAMSTRRADRVGQWEDPPESLDDPRSQPANLPPPRWWLATLGEPPAARHVPRVTANPPDLLGAPSHDG